MNDIKFDSTPGLGNVVEKMQPFCVLNKQMPIPTIDDIIGDFRHPDEKPGLAGRKFSKICGFTFKSNKPGVKYPVFQFVFVPKLKTPLQHNYKRGLSGWYCWKFISKTNKEVTSIEDMLRIYGFNVNAFAHSDVFDKYVKLFIANINYALSNQVQQLLDEQMPEKDRKELVRHINAVKDSLAHIYDVKQIATIDDEKDDESRPEYARGSAPKVGHAKVAYNADKTYRLDTKNKPQEKRYSVDGVVKKTQQQLKKQQEIALQKAAEMVASQYDDEDGYDDRDDYNHEDDEY